MTYAPYIQPPIKWLLIRPTQGALIMLGAISLLFLVVLMAWTILIRISFGYLNDFLQTENLKNDNNKGEKLTTHINAALGTYKPNEFLIGAIGCR